VWTHRQFVWHVVEPDQVKMAHLTGQVHDVLQTVMDDTPQFFRNAWVGGGALGILEFGVTVSDRDRWWVGRRARMLSEQLRKHTDLPVTLVAEEPVKLPPHPNRGKYRLRRLRRKDADA
jgi:hypothetical protein